MSSIWPRGRYPLNLMSWLQVRPLNLLASSKLPILGCSANSSPLAEYHEQGRHDDGHKRNHSDENEGVLDTHPFEPWGECKLDDHCKAVTDEDNGDKGVIENLVLLVWPWRIMIFCSERTYKRITIC